jgi:type IV pilus assembly protein PilB
MPISPEKLGQILIASGRLSAAQVAETEKSARRRGLNLSDFLAEENLLSKEDLGQLIGAAEDLSYVNLRADLPDHHDIAKISEDIARQYRLIFFRDNEEEIYLATDEPERAKLLLPKLQGNFFPKRVLLVYALPEDIDFILAYYYKAPLKTRFVQIIAAGDKVAKEIVTEILHDALIYNTSDIHIEPQAEEIRVRFRVDGVLREAGFLPRDIYDTIVNYIKVQCGLRIDEHLTAQDGAFKFNAQGREVNARVSILPILDGEKITIRILNKFMRNFALGEIGLEPADQELLEQENHRSSGMILVTGPCGAGKSTTVFSLLKQINNPEINIMTLEDPIEHHIKGINQTQINPQSNLSFAQGLRSLIRQNPDVIMLGEIRDQETAEIAVNAAATGTLLLSTFQATDSITAITRLIDGGIDPFLLISSLHLIIVQRLTRRLCPYCQERADLSVAQIEAEYGVSVARYFADGEHVIFKAKGCGSCGHTGHKGRLGIFELVRITPEVQSLILKRASAPEILKVVASQEGHSLFADGIIKVKNGLISLEELLRVANP